MPVKLNSKGRSNARSLIESDKIDTDSSWSFSADDGNKILGEDDWAEYGKWFMGVDSDEDSETKAHYKYPFGKNGKVYRSGLIAIRQRSAQQNEDDIYSAAGKLIDKIDNRGVNMTKIETRSFKSDLKVEKREDGRAGVISGYAIVYDKPSEDIGFIETIKSGAAKKALKRSDVRALIDHISYLIVGRDGKNLNLKEDKKGVFMELSRPKIRSDRFEQLASDIENGFIDTQSFAFTVTDKGASWNEDWTRREVTEIEEIYDVSLVTYAAYNDTSATFRSVDTTVAMEERKKAMEAAKVSGDSQNDKTSDDDQTDPKIEVRNSDDTSDADNPKIMPPSEDELDKRYYDALRRQEGF